MHSKSKTDIFLEVEVQWICHTSYLKSLYLIFNFFNNFGFISYI